MFELLVDAVPLALIASIPLLLAVEGELVVQRGGMINLSIEGMMLVAAMTAAFTGQFTMSAIAGFAGGIAGALVIAALFGIFAIALRADQIVTGTALNLLALGLTSFLDREVPLVLDDSPRIELDIVPALAWIVVPFLLAVVLWHTSFGLRLRACGENPEAITAAGRSVRKYRWSALMIEAILVGLGGAYLSLALTSGFAENMTAGRGFIALSIVIFGRWKLKGALAGAAIFGVAAAMQYALQAANRGIPFHILLAVPYVVTLLFLCGVAGRVRAPESLGK